MTTPHGEVLGSVRPWGTFEQFVTNEVATVAILTVQPGEWLPPYRHRLSDTLWQVLDGRLVVEVAGLRREVARGDRVLAARGVGHRVGNVGPDVVRLLEIRFGPADPADEVVHVGEVEGAPSTPVDPGDQPMAAPSLG